MANGTGVGVGTAVGAGVSVGTLVGLTVGLAGAGLFWSCGACVSIGLTSLVSVTVILHLSFSVFLLSLYDAVIVEFPGLMPFTTA